MSFHFLEHVKSPSLSVGGARGRVHCTVIASCATWEPTERPLPRRALAVTYLSGDDLRAAIDPVCVCVVCIMLNITGVEAPPTAESAVHSPHAHWRLSIGVGCARHLATVMKTSLLRSAECRTKISTHITNCERVNEWGWL